MVQELSPISLEELLAKQAETESGSDILKRLKPLAQERLLVGWTSWQVARFFKEIF